MDDSEAQYRKHFKTYPLPLTENQLAFLWEALEYYVQVCDIHPLNRQAVKIQLAISETQKANNLS